MTVPRRLAFLVACVALTVHLSAEEPVLEVFFLPGCHDCQDFEAALRDGLVPTLQDLGLKPGVQTYDILKPDGYERLMSETTRLGWEYRGVPLLKAGDRFFYGNELFEPGLAKTVAQALVDSMVTSVASTGAPEGEGAVPASSSGKRTIEFPDTEGIPALNLWVILGAGLVDGVNPCALATLLFMVSALALGGRRRITVGVIGAGFITGVFTAYYLIGLGLLQAGLVLSSAPHLRSILRVLTSLGLWGLGVASLRDWRAVRQGRPGEVSLRLSDTAIRRIHAVIRGGAAVWVSGIGAAGLGVLVSVGEFVCTGQVYLPTLVYIAQGGNAGALGLLAAYNLAFILPLAVIFVLVITGMSHARLSKLFRRNLAATKLVLAIFFISFGTLMMAGVKL